MGEGYGTLTVRSILIGDGCVVNDVHFPNNRLLISRARDTNPAGFMQVTMEMLVPNYTDTDVQWNWRPKNPAGNNYGATFPADGPVICMPSAVQNQEQGGPAYLRAGLMDKMLTHKMIVLMNGQPMARFEIPELAHLFVRKYGFTPNRKFPMLDEDAVDASCLIYPIGNAMHASGASEQMASFN